MTASWLPVILLATFSNPVTPWGINHAGLAGTNAKCERMSVSMCRGLGYNLTAMPNFMGHEDQLLAERGVSIPLYLILPQPPGPRPFHFQILRFQLAIINSGVL